MAVQSAGALVQDKELVKLIAAITVAMEDPTASQLDFVPSCSLPTCSIWSTLEGTVFAKTNSHHRLLYFILMKFVKKKRIITYSLLLLHLFLFNKVVAQESHKQNLANFRCSNDLYIVSDGGKMHVSTKSFKRISQAYDTIYNFYNGMAIVGRIKNNVSRSGKNYTSIKYGFINSAGLEIIPTQYADVNLFEEGLTYVYANNTSYWFDKNGKTSIALRDVQGSNFQGGFARILISNVGLTYGLGYSETNYLNKKINYIDKKGNVLIPNFYDSISPYEKGAIRVVMKRSKFGLMDTLGVKLYDFIFDDIQPFPDSMLWVKYKKKWGFVSINKKNLFPFKYNSVVFLSKNFSILKNQRHHFLFDKINNRITQINVDSVGKLCQNRALYILNDRYGYIDSVGNYITPAMYINASNFSKGQAEVSTFFWKGIINTSGQRIYFRPTLASFFLLVFIITTSYFTVLSIKTKFFH